MPGVKRLHQESENSSKAKYIFGHMFGAVGVLIGDISRMFCVPISMKIHDGVESIRQWNESDKNTGSHIVQMIENSFDAAKIMRKSLLLLDAFFIIHCLIIWADLIRIITVSKPDTWLVFGAGEGNRTRGLRITSALLYQLSYTSI